MILDSTLLRLEAVLAGAVSANQPEAIVDYLVWNVKGEPTAPSTFRVALNSNTDVTILAACANAGERREPLRISIYNKDTASVTLTVKTDDGTTERIIIKATLQTLERLEWEKGRGWYSLDASGNEKVASTPGGMSPITAALGADVLLDNTANFFDGPSIAQGTVGTWWVSGTVNVTDSAGAARFFVKLWDGTSIIAAVEARTAAAGEMEPVTLSGYIATPAGNLRMSARDITATTGRIESSGTGDGKSAVISAIRIG